MNAEFYFQANSDIDRAGKMLQMADRLGCRAFVTPRDIVNGHEKLNMAFVANLFNNHPKLDAPEETDEDECISKCANFLFFTRATRKKLKLDSYRWLYNTDSTIAKTLQVRVSITYWAESVSDTTTAKNDTDWYT